MKFAIITPALMTGAFVERIRFSSLIIFTLLWTTLVYDPVAHWIWGVGGWLRDAFFATFVIAKLIDRFHGLSVGIHEEEVGLDIAQHGEELAMGL